MAAISKAGVLYHTIRNSAFNGEAFKSSLVELNSVCQQKGIINPVFVLDNCRIHHYIGLRVTIEALGLNLMFLPPYSLFLNPIENVFSVWENEVIRAGSKNEQELNEVIQVGKVQRIMLDNFTPDQIRKVIPTIPKHFETEASGGITEHTIADYAQTGVDFISVGAITHSVKSLDLSLKAC